MYLILCLPYSRSSLCTHFVVINAACVWSGHSGIASLRQRSQSENKQRLTIIQNDKSMQDKSRSIPRALRFSLVFFENLHCQMSDFLLCFPYLQSWALSRRSARLAKQMLMIHIHWVFLVAGPPWSFFCLRCCTCFYEFVGCALATSLWCHGHWHTPLFLFWLG